MQGQVKEKVQLSKTVTQKNSVVKTLKQKEKELQTNITKKQAEAAKLDAQIEAIIKKEIELARLAEEKKQKRLRLNSLPPKPPRKSRRRSYQKSERGRQGTCKRGCGNRE